MMDKKVNWGVLGTANIARGCTIPGMLQSKYAKPYAVAGRSLEKAESFKQEFGFEKAYGSYEELLADPEVQAVYIPLPNHLHYEWCMKAMEAGKNVLCEKPLVPTQKEAEELAAAAKKNGVFLMEAFAYLHSPYVAAVKEELKKGTIGEIKYIESAFLVQSCADDDIRMFKEMYGGAFYDLGCYPLSLMNWLLDSAPESCKAMGEFTERGIDIYSAAYLKYPGDIRASIDCGMMFGRSRFSRFDRLYIHGTKGYIKSDVEYNQSGDLQFTVNDGTKSEIRKVHADNNYMLEADQLSSCILFGETPHVSNEFSIREAGAIDAVIKAMGY